MSNINSNQFNNSFVNGFNQHNILNPKTAGINQNQIQMQMQEQKTPLEVLFPKYLAQLSQTSNELAMLNNSQIVNMLKDLLNLPKDFQQLLLNMINNIQDTNIASAFLLLSANIDMANLSNLLRTNSKEAMSNLYQMLAHYNQIGVSLKDEQIAEISKLISFVAVSASSDSQTLRTTMLMYLPWLPLTDLDAFKLSISKKDIEDDLGSDDSITLFISTENYGNIQADIFKTVQDGIRIAVITSETFPQKDFELLMREESKKYNININLDKAVKEAFNKSKNEKSKTQVSMNTSPGVNPFLLLISNAVIKNVHIIDEKENLREQRKEKLDNGQSKN